MNERFYWLGFSAFPGIGPIKFQALIKHFGSAKDSWFAKQTDLKSVLGQVLTAKFEKFRNQFSIKDYADKVRSKKASFLILTDKEYPKLLKEIPNPPFVIYILSNLRNLSDPEKTIAVVGTRKITQYGRDVTTLLTEELVNAGFTIVSGLAFGVDSVAHQTAVEAGGLTIAVLGCGVDCCYPSSNQPLYNSIVEKGGAIVSEFPLGQPPQKGSFPSRNRIIAGLSLGVLVTEGAEDSGALITADYALKFKRKVFAVPGPITSSLSRGPHKLLSKGAKLVVRVEDIISELGITGSTSTTGTTRRKGETKEEEKILEILENEARHFDEIVRVLKMDSAKVGSILSIMEIKGLVRSSDNGTFSINN